MTIFHVIKYPPPDGYTKQDLDNLPTAVLDKFMAKAYPAWEAWRHDNSRDYPKIYAQYREFYIQALLEHEGDE